MSLGVSESFLKITRKVTEFKYLDTYVWVLNDSLISLGDYTFRFSFRLFIFYLGLRDVSRFLWSPPW